MLLQMIINIFQPQGYALRIMFLVFAVLYTALILIRKCFPGAGSFMYAFFSGAVYPVFVFLIGAVHPFSDHPEGALRLALFLEIILLVLAFLNSRISLPGAVPAILCTYMLSWFFFAKVPVSFTAMSDFLYLIVPNAFVLIMGGGAAEEAEERKKESPEMKALRLQGEFETRNRNRNKIEVGGVEIYSDPDGTVREARDQYGYYTVSGFGWKNQDGHRLSHRQMEEKGLDRFV